MTKKVRGYSKVSGAEVERARASLPAMALAPLRRDKEGVAHVIGLSGGKDSTALALRMRELHPELPLNFLCTPTGDELPELVAHWAYLEQVLGQPLIRLTNRTLNEWIDGWKMLPNFRARWCTRVLKIVPAQVFVQIHGNVLMYVGFRADEEGRAGIYDDSVRSVYPMRDDWGWDLTDVRRYLRDRGVKIPRRTDCARCFYQRIVDWHRLWRDHPDLYASAEKQEKAYGHTFRSPLRDTWPASLEGLRGEFERGRPVPGLTPKERGQESLFPDLDDEDAHCRVCSL